MTVTLNIYVACVIQKTKTIRFVIKLPRECYACIMPLKADKKNMSAIYAKYDFKAIKL